VAAGEDVATMPPDPVTDVNPRLKKSITPSHHRNTEARHALIFPAQQGLSLVRHTNLQYTCAVHNYRSPE
jgi:hypothetical protein